MVGLQKKTNLPIATVRASLEITVMSMVGILGGLLELELYYLLLE